MIRVFNIKDILLYLVKVLIPFIIVLFLIFKVFGKNSEKENRISKITQSAFIYGIDDSILERADANSDNGEIKEKKWSSEFTIINNVKVSKKENSVINEEESKEDNTEDNIKNNEIEISKAKDEQVVEVISSRS